MATIRVGCRANVVANRKNGSDFRSVVEAARPELSYRFFFGSYRVGAHFIRNANYSRVT